ncbi:MAG TPA: VWA domain-containing protein [Terriglobales bacterium]
MPSYIDSRRVLACCFFCLFTTAALAVQSQPETYRSQETLKAKTRLVIVDVVATDSHGQAVTNLKTDDFTVLEEGKPQKISNFTFQHPGEGAGALPPLLPPHVVTNVPAFKSGLLNVILFDGINGEFASQAYARDQLIKFFSSGTLDQPVAVFALESRVRLLHDFTTDAAALKAAIEKYQVPAQAATTESFESRESPFATYGDFHTNERNIETTLNQLNALAKILAGYPGRKNLIWLSESFPLSLFPEQILRSSQVGDVADNGHGGPERGAPDTFDTMVQNATFKNFAALVKKVAEAMMGAQVAVYPVDAAGVGKNDHVTSQHTANDMAERTGGKAFHNSNELASSMRASLNDGSTYYTLEYYPENRKWDGQFRTIQIKTERSGVSLRYRLGYYAVDPVQLEKDEAGKISEEFSRFLQKDAPGIAEVRFQAGVMPPASDTRNKLLVNFAVDPHTVLFERSDDGVEHAKLICTIWAYGKDQDKPIMSKGDTVTADLKPEVYAQVMKQYFPCKQELDLKPGTYTLRLGVLDRNSNQMGTTSTAVTLQ